MALDWNNLTDAQFLNLFGYPRNPPLPKPFAQWKQPYNSMGLASYAQARALVAAINATQFLFANGQRPMGGGVLPGDDEPVEGQPAPEGQTGIFIEVWVYVGSGDATDEKGVKYFRLDIRFQNGAVMNAGSVLDSLSRYPRAQSYAVGHIAADVEQNAIR